MRFVPYEGMGWLGMGVGLLFCALLALLVIWVVWRLTSAGGRAGGPLGGPPPGGSPPGETPEDILRRRFAAGEIDEAEYERRLEVLRRR
jgi:putative membrane protein